MLIFLYFLKWINLEGVLKMNSIKYEGNVVCPHCGYNNILKIPSDMWLTWTTCQGCSKAIWGHDNPHGWNWVFCTFGDVPWINEQKKGI